VASFVNLFHIKRPVNATHFNQMHSGQFGN